MANDEHTSKSRRDFLVAGGGIALGAMMAGKTHAEEDSSEIPESLDSFQEQDQQPSDITNQTIAEAEKLAGVEFSEKEREMIASRISGDVRGFKNRRDFELKNSFAPATVFDPRLPGINYEIPRHPLVRSNNNPGPIPSSAEDIAFAPVTSLSRWFERREITSMELTKIYLARIKKYGPALECIVTITQDLALKQASQADKEIAAGKYRGPLHGIPWGGKDLLDTKGIRTSWGAMPYKDRVADSNATVVKLLEEAGAVLVAKTTLGALAYGDIWFEGRTNNPWNLKQGSSGSSAGSASGTAAGLYGFSIGTETLGSIVSPCTRCGTTGLRPTFGRVSRAGAMALCWSLDKIGPICRTVEDCALVLNAINSYDTADASSIDIPFNFDADKSIRGMRVGYDPKWFEGRRVSETDKHCLEIARRLGVDLVEIKLPDLPYGSMITILNVEAASAFEELTLSNRDDELKWQAPQAWPNTFRKTRLTPAVEFLQAERIRRQVMKGMHNLYEDNKLDTIIGPSFAGSMLLITNFTGHPCVVFRAGFAKVKVDREDENSPEVEMPLSFTVWGKLFNEGTMCNLAMAMEKELDVWAKRPPIS